MKMTNDNPPLNTRANALALKQCLELIKANGKPLINANYVPFLQLCAYTLAPKQTSK